MRIMTCEIAREAWNILKELYQSKDRTSQMQVLNLKRDLKILSIKEKESI